MAGTKVEQEPERIEPFLTIKVNIGVTRSRAECLEFGIGVGGQTPEQAVAGLHALVRDHSEAVFARAQTEILVEGRPIEPEIIELAKRVLQVPQGRMAEAFR